MTSTTKLAAPTEIRQAPSIVSVTDEIRRRSAFWRDAWREQGASTPVGAFDHRYECFRELERLLTWIEGAA